MSGEKNGLVTRIIRFTTIYGLWILSATLALFIAYQLVEIFIDLAFLLRFNPWQVRAVRNFGTVTVGLFWLIFAIGSEAYFRRYVEPEQQAQRLVYFFVIEFIVAGVLTLLNYMLL